MALTGLQIQKLLPGTNCRECGSNTCMAFAMKLASKKAELSLCPYASDEAKQVLGAASEPPVRTIALGVDKKLSIGGETVLYRHEKTFVNPTAIAVNINDTDSPETTASQLELIRSYRFERVGESFVIDMVAVTQKGNDGKKFADLAERISKEAGRPLLLRSADAIALEDAARRIAGSNSVLCVPSPEMAERLLSAAKDNGHALAVCAPDMDSLTACVTKIRDAGFGDILLDFSVFSLSELFQVNSIARRAAIKDNYRPLGYPHLRFVKNGDMLDDAVEAVTGILKYGGIVVLPAFDAAMISSLMTLRLNIFTDPQKPIQVEPKIYAIGDPTPDSPVFVTTNFSLTFFVVSGEIENSGVSAWLLVPECEGMSVLTAWAAGKFTASTIAKFIKEIELESQVRNRTLIIPGYVAQISGELEDKLPGWRITVGPQEAADLEGFVKAKISV